MQRFNTLLFLLVVGLAAAMQAQAPAPKPDPELKKLAVFVGRWTYAGEYKPGPLGPGGRVTGEYTAQMILGGFVLQARWAEKGAMGETRGLEIIRYDPVNRNYPSSEYHDDGIIASGAYTINGNTWTYTGKFVVAGKEYMVKDTEILAADLRSLTANAEISADGNTWTPFYEGKYKKAKPHRRSSR